MRQRDTDPKLSLATIEDLKGKGWSQTKIAEEYGVTRQYISWIKHTYGGRLTPKEIVLQNFPWKVPTSMCQASPYRRMRDHGEFMATGGEGMSEVKLKRLRSFYQKLRDEDVVIEFDPDIPPTPGIASQGGFAYRKRKAKDGDLMIRVNEYANVTEEGRMIWRIPPIEP
ncbi:helix-turn-helix domain-containing protein [Mycobacteroides salmoniphilum]|uniref:helix-turn-helix domain-containing protein n=1 Tax=Mycobacteroides salmoniphilum TaxID=404941 RepID=UPI000993C045|nr:helix-turn-helix domain-containing protein [Mycobacteroides salmoniphilum]